MRIFTLLLLLITISSCYPKLYSKYPTRVNPVYEYRYSDFHDSESELVAADIYQTIEKKKDGKFVLKVYNPDKMIMSHEIHCSDKKTSLKNGKYTEWYDNKSLWKKGQYLNNKKEGFWEFFSHKGYRDESGNFENDLREGIWVKQDSLGRIRSETTFEKGVKNGETRLFTKEGEVYQINRFKDGEFISKETLIEEYFEGRQDLHSNEPPTLLSCADIQEPDERIKCGEDTFRKTLLDNVKYPEDAFDLNISGTTLIQFSVNEEGKMEDIIVLRGVCDSIEKETLRVVSLTGEWAPAHNLGYFQLPLGFRLEQKNSNW